MVVKICCIKLTLATRIIAMVGLIAAVLVLTQLSTELADPGNSGGTVSILLGLDVDDFRKSHGNATASIFSAENLDIQGIEVLVAFLIFSFIYATASAILIWGSIVEVSAYAFPWLFCEAVSFFTLIVTVIIHIINADSKKDRWIIILCVFNILLSFYFWIVVFCAARSWSRKNREERRTENASTSTLSSGNETINDEGLEAPIQPKCVQV